MRNLRSLFVVSVAALVLGACSTIDESHYTPPPPTPVVISPSAGPSIYPVPSPRPPRSPKPVFASPVPPVFTSPPALSPPPAPPSPSPTSATFTKTKTETVKKGDVVVLEVNLKGSASAGTFRAQWSAGKTTTTIKGPGTTINAGSGGIVHQSAATSEVFQVPSPDAGAWTMRTKVGAAPGGSVTVTLTYTSVPKGNKPPVAKFSLTRKQKVVTVDGSASKDPDGSIASWAWDWGDDSTGSGQSAKHTYGSGTYTITLTVTDNQGRMRQATNTVTVP